MTEHSYRGVYINLDRSNERRAQMEAQIAALGLSETYARLPAVEGATLDAPLSKVKPGELGCFLSHRRALELARSTGKPVHVLEDDTILSADMRSVIEDAISDGLLDRVDLLYLDTFVHCQPLMLKGMKSLFDHVAARRPLRLADMQIIDLSQQNFSGTTSYVVGPRASERVLALMHRELASGPRVAFDIFLRETVRAGGLRLSCVFPFLTSLRLDAVNASTLRGEDPNISEASVAALAALRYSFFIDRDLDNVAKPYLEAAIGPRERKPDPHRELMGQVIDFVLSDDFKVY
jgi:GR25 family glycosyltransferase involved in LPS biosynthesis